MCMHANVYVYCHVFTVYQDTTSMSIEKWWIGTHVPGIFLSLLLVRVGTLHM